MANRLRWVPLSPKVNPFQGEISRDQDFRVRLRSQYSAVISNSGLDEQLVVAPPGIRQSTDFRDEGFFWQRHDNTVHRVHESREFALEKGMG